LPLSFAQQRLWFLDQLEPGSSAYNIVATHRLIGPLDVVALEQGFNEVVRRHESLRTTVSVIDNEPRQIVAPAISIPLAVVDLGGLPMAEQEVEAQRVINQIGHQPFDLTRGPLIRTTLLRLRHTEHILIVTVHHMVSDAWSMNILFRELSHFYASFCRGESSSLPELAVQYGDFAVWQREWLQGQVLEAQLAYWRQHLKDSPAVLTLPADYPRPPVQTFRGELQSLQLPSKLCESLQALSRQENTTLFMVLLTAFKLLVYRYTRQEGVVIGIPVAGRNHTEVEGLIGFFISTLVLYTPFTDQDTFRELLAREREIELGAYDHQDIPFEKLVEELQPERSLSHTPLFQIFFNMTSAERHRLELEGLTVEPIPPAEPESKFDMTLYVNHVGGEIRSRLVYNADLFSAERMAELLAQYEQLLSQVVENPDLKITEFSLVTQRSSSLLPDPQETLPEPRYDLLTERFADWAQRTPDRLAISQNSRTWSYAELASSARELARVLLTQGLKRGDVIAVAGPSSFGLVASTLGAFLSGGVLLTLDENLPGERRRLMLQEARAKYLLSVGARSVEAEGPAQGLTVLEVAPDTGCVSDTRCRRQPARDTEPTLSARWPTREPGRLDVTSLPELSPEDAAYIFFTSGTTGVPKAILGCHKGLAHFLTWQRETFEIGPQDKGAQLAGLSFDAVLRDIFTPLTSGATLCLPEPGMGPDPARILPWLDREEVSLLHVVPSLVESWLLDLPDGVSLKSMRWVFFSGEPLTDSLVRRWRAAFPRAGEIVNLYGPTETTMIKCYYHVPADPPAGVQPAGRPQPETQALVLTRDNQRCGVGEPGEIVIRTPFRTLGYLNAAAENRRAFVPNPFRDDPLDLVYRTGDRGRYRSDGLLEILGRLDDQVKIRGVRIEPGEIAAVLRQHSEVGQAVVVACQDGPGDTRLVAYVVPVQGQSLIGGELRAFLRPKLPDPMIPSAFVFLERLPLTPNGKVDRRALPEPSGVVLDADQGHPLETPFAAPRTRAEETVADIWAHVLGRERIGIHDNFFDLGGHSLLATRIVSRLRAAFQVDLPLRKLFELPTVSGLAQYVETLHRLVQPAQNLFEESRDDREVIVI
jgi:amino acid adenylation domain-containing protein